MRARRVIAIYDRMLCEGMQAAVRLFTAGAAAALCLLTLDGCGPAARPPVGAAPEDSPHDPARASGYFSPPVVTAVTRSPGGLALSGHAVSGARVRLRAPSGQAVFATADRAGVWRAELPAAGELRIFSLAMIHADRETRGEGYLAVTPDGRVAMLLAGAGALVVGARSDRPQILAVDYDQGGAAMISGVARPGAGLQARVDRQPAGNVSASAAGRFTIGAGSDLRSGGHLIDVAGEGGQDAVQVVVRPAGGLSTPFVAVAEGGGWRIDWMTPAGGVQTTHLLSAPGAGG